MLKIDKKEEARKRTKNQDAACSDVQIKLSNDVIGIWNDWSFMIRAKIAFSKCTTNPNDDVRPLKRSSFANATSQFSLYVSNVYRRMYVYESGAMHGAGG